MNRMHGGVAGLAIAWVLALFASAAFAYPYATNIRPDMANYTAGSGSLTFSFILNQDATGTTLEVVSRVTGSVFRTVDLGPLTYGMNTWAWDGRDNANALVPSGQYVARITAVSTGLSATDWTKLDSITQNFFSPRGLSVNRNTDSPNFGRIYVSENGGLTGLGRTTQDGLYVMNSDGSDAVGQGDSARTSEAAWLTNTTASPWKTTISSDDRVWICDWSDPHAGVWVCDADGLNVASALDNSGQDSLGLNYQHGSVASMWTEGSGASTILYTIDEDFGTPAAQLGSIWSFPVGNGPFPYTGAPTVAVDDSALGDKNLNYNNDMFRDRRGAWWISQNRFGGATDTLASLWKVSSDGTAVQFSSVPDLAPNSLADPLRQTNSIAYDPVYDRMAFAIAGTGTAKLAVVSIAGGTFDLGSMANITYTGTNRRVAFDAVGNLYSVNNTKEEMAVWSPPGPSTYTSSGAVVVQVAGVGVEGDATGDGCVDDADLTSIILDYGGPSSGQNGDTDVNNDGVVDDADITIAILNFGAGC